MERRKRSTRNAALAPDFAAHKLITKYLGAVVYFADSYVSWQKGAIENTNSSDSIFQNKPTLMKLQIKRLRSYRRKSIIDPGKIMFETPKAEFFKRVA